MASPVLSAAEVEASAVRGELVCLLESREIRKSPQLRRLLEFLVEETLAGRGDALKEYHVGLSVFHRGADFDPRLDSIVRVQASILRKKLEAHYAQTASGLRIRIPRGSYMPEWAAVEALPHLDSTPSPRRHFLWAGASAIAGATATALIQRPRESATAPALWTQFFDTKVETVVSFGVPLFFTLGNGLYIRDVHVNRPGDPDHARLDRLSQVLGTPARAQEDVYTGIGEAVGVHLVSEFLTARRVTTKLANSHYLGPPDLSGKNLVIVSSMRFQTLLDSLRLPHAFEFEPIGNGILRNLRPLPGEPRIYGHEGPEVSYSRVTLWPSATPGHRILSFSGRETWATQASVQFAVDPQEQTALQARLDADPANGPRGAKSAYFEVLLKVLGKNNRVQRTEYVSHRYLEVPLPLRFR